MIKAVLFDLDGTLADTAPDLCYAINQMRAARGLPRLPLAATRPVTSLGARGLLDVGLGVTPEHPTTTRCATNFSTSTPTICAAKRDCFRA